ncbi:MAG: ABC transporter permease subunit [Mobilitalea sp.]
MQATKQIDSGRERITEIFYIFYRIVIIFTVISLFIPGINPAKICGLINGNLSLLSSGVSYSALTENLIRVMNKGWVNEGTFILLNVSSIIACIGIVGAGASGCLSLGSLKMKRLGNRIGMLSAFVGMLGMVGIAVSYQQVSETTNPEKVIPNFPFGYFIFIGILVLVFVLAVILQILLPKPGEKDVYEMASKYKLFLLLMPFIVLIFVFSYLPLWGWRYAFFDYDAGGTLSKDNFVGFKWFTFLFQNDATKRDIARVLKNTLAMSGLGLGTMWIAVVFAIFLCEIKSLRMRRFVQTFTTIPNFISWVLVYSVATIIFSSEGLISNLIVGNGGTAVNFLMSEGHTWLKMLAWGIWKGIGWSAIIYIAGISGIDQQLYEAATVDGAGRFQRMWHVTVPGLVPTFCVLLIMGVAGILSNGLEQYLVFENPTNTNDIMVLDLYVYKLGIGKGNIPLSTVVGMVKSLISVMLLFGANRVSKVLRGSSII